MTSQLRPSTDLRAWAPMAAGPGIVLELLDTARQVKARPGRERQSVVTVLDKVEQPTRRRCHHRHRARQRLLCGLTEGLVRARVHEDVQRRERRGQLLATLEPHELGLRQVPFELTARRAVPHHDEPHPRQVGGGAEQADLLLVRQPPDVPDKKLVVRGKAPGQQRIPVRRVEAPEVDTARPAHHVVDTVVLQLLHGVPARREGPGGGAVDLAQPSPDSVLGKTQPVA